MRGDKLGILTYGLMLLLAPWKMDARDLPARRSNRPEIASAAKAVDSQKAETRKALDRFYRTHDEVFIPDWQGNGEWVSVHRGDERGRGLSPSEIQQVIEMVSRTQGVRPGGSGKSCLASITCYWKIGRDTDHWTRAGQSSTGVTLRRGVVAVDPKVIPYGSLVLIEGVPGAFVAADCGSAVIDRVAVRKTARNPQESQAIVIDVFFVEEKDGLAFDARLPKFVKIQYFAPGRA